MSYFRLAFLLFLAFHIYISQTISQVTEERKSEDDVKLEDQFIAAKLLVASGKKNEAIKLLDSLRRVSAPSAAIYFELAKLNNDKKDINQTESNLKSAVQLEPDNIYIRRFQVIFSREMGRTDVTVQTLTHLITLQPKQSEYYDQLSVLHISEKEYEKAIQILELKEKNIGWSVNTTIKKAEILDVWGKTNESIATLSILTKKYPGDKKYYRLIINILHSNDKIAESEPYLKKILEIDPNDNDAKLGLLLLKKGKGTQDDYFTSLLPLISNPDAPIDLKIKELMSYVQKHAMSGDTLLGNQLISLCDKLVIAHPYEAKSHAVYADVLKNNGNYTSAIRQYEKTLLLNNKNYAVWEQLMFCLLITENYEQLLKTSTDAIDYFPNQAMSYYFNAKSWLSNNDLKKAESNLTEAIMIGSGNPEIESRVNTALAELNFRKKDWAKAKTLVDQALSASNNQNADACELKGDILKETNDIKNAAIFWQKAYDLGLRSQKLLYKLESVKNN